MKNDITTKDYFSVIKSANIDSSIVERVARSLPELEEKTKAFDRSNSQTMLQLMSLTMLNGQSPMRLLRQILAETERRKLALAEAQFSHAKLVSEIERLEGLEQTNLSLSELTLKRVNLYTLEGKINGAFKDIAALCDAYDSIKITHNIEDWDEETFELSEKKHHIRRGFELLYRNLVECGRAKEATIEYLQQYGVHLQMALAEAGGYMQHVDEEIAKGAVFSASHMECFFDEMSEKYLHMADEASERIFGKPDIANRAYMTLSPTNKKHSKGD